MRRFLERTRAHLGPAPRTVALPALVKPAWLGDDDGLSGPFQASADLLARGKVRWGFVVQANSVLFEPGDFDSVMSMVVGTEESSDDAPGTLQYIAGDLARLRALGERGWQGLDPEATAIARYLDSETDRDQGLVVPASLNRGVPCAVYTVFCFRSLLPGGFLARHLLPVLVGSDAEQGALVVPSEYWDESLQEVWS